jgi:type I restriction enzyme S subunit
MRLTDLQNDKRSLRQGLVKERGIITSAYDAIDVGKGHDARFWAYALLALDLAKYYYSLGGGVRQSIKFADFPNDWIATPDLPIQEAIADFLDRETARIDLLIEKKLLFANLLSERERSATVHILTGRTQSALSVKDSRLAWVGHIPSHWNEQPLKQVATVIDCKHTTPDYVDDGIPLISTGEVKPYSISFTSQRLVSENDYTVMTEGGRAPEPHDIIYSRNASVGAAAMVRDSGRFCMGQDICLIRPTGVTASFLEHELNSEIVLQQLGALLVGSTLKRVNVNNIKNFVLCLPPANEQMEIAKQVDKALAKSRRHRELLSKSVARLREFRSALITAAVTGQVDVESWGKRGETDRRLDRIREAMSA